MQAVLYGIGYFHAGQVEAVTVGVRIHEHGADLAPAAVICIRRVKQGLKVYVLLNQKVYQEHEHHSTFGSPGNALEILNLMPNIV
jgi:hypothetical protein